MSQLQTKYRATGIILKGSSFNESDRLVTILTQEYGLIRAIVPGAKKHKSQLRGKTELFVVSQLLVARGRTLDKVIQAETVYIYSGLSKDLGQLAAAQYLAELALYLSVEEQQPQQGLYELLNEHLRRLERLRPQQNVYPYLAQAVFHFLAIVGIAPEVYICCVTQKLLDINYLNSNWRGGFSYENGGIIDMSYKKAVFEKNQQEKNGYDQPSLIVNCKINALELMILQHLHQNSLPEIVDLIPLKLVGISLDSSWVKVENILRKYIQHHLGKSIRSADLVDNLYLVEF